MSAKKMRNFSRHKNTGDLHRWYVLYAECLFLPYSMYGKYLILNAAASSLDPMHDGLMLYIRCSCRDFFESFAPLRFFLHFCNLFLVTPATEARPACISFDSLMPKIRSPDGSEFLSFQYRKLLWNSSFLSGKLRNASVCLDLCEHGLQYNCVVVRCR